MHCRKEQGQLISTEELEEELEGMISSVDKAKSGTQDQTKEMIKIFTAENVERCSPATAASTCHPLAAVMTNTGSICGLIECIVEEEQGQLISTEELEGMISSVDKAKRVGGDDKLSG
ncbi:hypothetical protein DAPPUDRAFT_315349 [Daphnia pulex]|uniref:Uncharacterized protein n=1 Tax=Daphnia pulex TaxID=6669 RepID=E9G9H4_DAPPU|nr:hypothetical protein DAPPUDRAFT_315349 [Daphnia pulex]|eukprot:EFX83876.1 hypothetical protein DAPPUDRAFT_315349 [Daphnia pulex]